MSAPRRRLAIVACVLAAGIVYPARAGAQAEPNPLDKPRFTIGPIGLVPTVAIRDAGVDSNVFNSETNPRQDYTATLTTTLDAGMRAGRVRVRAKGQLDYVSFAKTVSENSLNGTGSVRLEAPLGLITPRGWYSAVKTRHRPGFEIDARARRLEHTSGASLDLRVTAKTTVTAAVQRMRISFDGDEFFLGTNLREVLNRDQDTVSLGVRYSATPLTTVIVQGEGRRDRFAFSPHRNADSVRVVSGFEFDALALVTGQAFVGVRRFEPHDPRVPVFRGAVAYVTLASRLGPRLKLTIDAQRDLDYSFNPLRPYYVSENAIGTVSLGVTTAWDLVVRGGRYRLNWRGDLTDLGVTDRQEIVDIAGGGIGYRFSRTRLGIDADLVDRFANATSRRYHSLRIITSVSHGF